MTSDGSVGQDELKGILENIITCACVLGCCFFHTKHQKGRSALIIAAGRGHVDVMKALIGREADISTQDKVCQVMLLLLLLELIL